MKKILFPLLGAAMMTVAWSQEQLQLTLDRTITMAGSSEAILRDDGAGGFAGGDIEVKGIG